MAERVPEFTKSEDAEKITYTGQGDFRDTTYEVLKEDGWYTVSLRLPAAMVKGQDWRAIASELDSHVVEAP